MSDDSSGFYIDRADDNSENGIKRVELTREEFVFLAEIMRYISSTGIRDMHSKIDRSLQKNDVVYDLDSKIGIAVYSTWQLCGDLKDERWVGTNVTYEVQPVGGKLSFSAHSHPYLPHTPSPDDLLIISQMKGEYVNYIVDRFVCVEYDIYDSFKYSEQREQKKNKSHNDL